MIKRLAAFILTMVMLLSSFSSTTFACDENQTNTYIAQMLFGDSAVTRSSDEKTIMLFNALYLCSEQTGGQGQDKIDYLKSHRVFDVPALTKLTIKADDLLDCSHNTWEHEFTSAKKNQSNRRKVLRNTVNKVFDFGMINNLFNSSSGKCNSFAALLYYSHILADYLADDPSNTEATVKERSVSSYFGQPYVVINGDVPSFTTEQKKNTTSFAYYSQLDWLGRAGVAFGNIGPDIMPPSNSRQQIGKIKPSGWNQKKYKEIIGTEFTPGYIFERCHLIAHQLAGNDGALNLITGTDYLNHNGMLPIEEEVAKYIRISGNHVLYRVTPIYKGDNLLASGVQIEAYSVEDKGQGISCNRYCYNVQPGFDINYANGNNSVSDSTIGVKNILPFAVNNPSDNKPDLIYEMDKHLEILFEDQKNTSTYTSMINSITTIANEARAVGNHGENAASCYIALKEYQYEYFDVLKSYIPLLLNKEDFFKSAF